MAVAVDKKLFSVSYFCFPKVLQARVLHDGLDGADPNVCLLSVPFDQVDGNPSPAVTPATGVTATPWTVQQIHITTYIFKSEFWYISDDVQLVKKKKNLQTDCAGLSRPIRKQRSVAPMMTPLGLMLTVKNQKILNTHPQHTLFILGCCFFSFSPLPVAPKLRTGSPRLHNTHSKVAEFAVWSEIKSLLSHFLTPHISFCGREVGVLPWNWCTAAWGCYCLLGLSSIFICYLG